MTESLRVEGPRPRYYFVMLALLLFAPACSFGPSEEDCRAACKEADDACTESDVMEKCVERCQEDADDEQVEHAKDCGGYGYCSLGLCCAGFYYDESGKERNCEDS